MGGGLVFTDPGGGPIRRANFRGRVWLPATRAAGLDGLRFHDLRHSHAAILIGQGVHAKVIQGRLGHSKITTTLDTYGHLVEGLDRDAADRLDAVMAEGRRHYRDTKPVAEVIALPKKAKNP